MSSTDESAPAATEEAAVDLDLQVYGWLSEVALDPSAFADLVDTNRDGWVALHSHDYREALEAFAEQPESRARAELYLGLLYHDLGVLSGLANEQLYSEWDAREGLPNGNHAPLMAALASWCSEGDTTGSWAGRAHDEGLGSSLAQALVQGRSALDVTGSDAYGRRLAVHRNVRSGGPLQPLMDASLVPLISVDEKDFTREFWDPCIWRTLADRWTETAGRSLGGTSWRAMSHWARDDASLESRMFAAWPSATDLGAELIVADHPGLLGARSPLLRKLGVGTDAFASDDPEAARDEVRALDEGMDAWKSDLKARASEDGQALIDDLSLFHRFRQEWLVTRARLALDNNRPRQSLAYLELARDKSERSIGVSNSPSLIALIAQAQLRLGHTREALDALHLLTDRFPETFGLKEVVADLAVLQGLDRQGDSKEN